MSVFWQQFWMIMATMVAGVVVLLIRYAISVLEQYIDKRLQPIQGQYANELLDAIGDAASATVNSLNQTIVTDLKTNGTFNSRMAADIRASAIQQVKTQLGTTLTDAAQKLLGDLDQLIATRIEQAVWQSKQIASTSRPIGSSSPTTALDSTSSRSDRLPSSSTGAAATGPVPGSMDTRTASNGATERLSEGSSDSSVDSSTAATA